MVQGRTHLLWDFDGTCADSEVLAMAQAARDLVEAFGAEALERGVLAREPCAERGGLAAVIGARWAGMTFAAMLERCEAVVGALPPGERKRWVHEHRARTVAVLADGCAPIAGVEATLARFAAAGVVQAVVTSSHLDRVAPCIARLGFAHFFGARVYSADSLGLANKPAPDVYLHALGALGIDAGAVVGAIEDSPSGVRAASDAGLAVVGFVAGAHIREKARHAATLMSAGARRIAWRGEDLAEVVAGLHLSI